MTERAEQETKRAEQEAKKAEQAKKAEEAKKAQEEELKKQQEALLAAAQAQVATGKLPDKGAWSYQGVTFTANQVAHFHKLWDYTGDAAEMVTHHSAAELQQVCKVDGVN